MNLRDKKVLVTGGAGFIGSHTVDTLIGEGAQVVVIDNLSTGRRENLNPEARFYECDLADPRVEAILEDERPDVIYHFAFFVLVPKSTVDPLLDLPVFEGTIRLLKKAADLKVQKFIFASSGFLYGNNPNMPVKESEPVDPVCSYVITKHAIEQYLESYRRLSGMSYAILRYPAVYGPRQVTGAMADYIRKLSAGEQADIWGDGTKTRDYVHVSDVVAANIAALDVADDHPHPLFNVGSGEETTLNDLYWNIAGILGKNPAPLYHPDRAGEQMRYSLDSSKIRRELGWKPTVSLMEGLQDVITSWNLPTQQ